MVHHTIKSRLANIAAVREWVGDRKEFNKEGRTALLRKVMLNIGGTRLKALEYLILVLGEDE